MPQYERVYELRRIRSSASGLIDVDLLFAISGFLITGIVIPTWWLQPFQKLIPVLLLPFFEQLVRAMYWQGASVFAITHQ